MFEKDVGYWAAQRDWVAKIPYAFRSCLAPLTGQHLPWSAVQEFQGYTTCACTCVLPQLPSLSPGDGIHTPLSCSQGKEQLLRPFPLVSPPAWPNPSFLSKYSQSTSTDFRSWKVTWPSCLCNPFIFLTKTHFKIYPFICFELVLLFTIFL